MMRSGIKTICLLQVEFNGFTPLGGAESIAIEVAKGLSDNFQVIILHGVKDPLKLDEIEYHGDGFYSLASYLHDDDIRYRGEISPELTKKSKEILRCCEVLISFERVLKERVAPVNITVLGGTGYLHCGDVVKSKNWDKLIVPSKFVYEWCVAHEGISREKVIIIHNGINTMELLNGRKEQRDLKSESLLIPSRPDVKKGFKESIDLANLLNEKGLKYSVKILKQKSFISNKSFYSDLEEYSKAKGVNLLYMDWVSKSNVSSLYNSSKFSTMIGEVPEGFGLSVIESIFCGTPVLAKRHGAVSEVLPPDHGVIFLDEIDLLSMTSVNFENAIEEARMQCLQYGRKYINDHYSLKSMINSYIKLVMHEK